MISCVMGQKTLYIIGAGGSARDVFFIARDCGYKVMGFVDLIAGKSLYGVPVVSEDSFNCNNAIVIAVGDPYLRKSIADKFFARGSTAVSLIHPSVAINETIKIGRGAVISQNSILTCDISIGEFVQLNVAVTITHECCVGNFCTFGPSVNVSGKVTIGDFVYLGTNCSIRENLTIASGVIIGSQASVIRDINESGVYVGVPAKKLIK